MRALGELTVFECLSDQEFCSSWFCPQDRIPGLAELDKEETFIWSQSFSGFNPWESSHCLGPDDKGTERMVGRIVKEAAPPLDSQETGSEEQEGPSIPCKAYPQQPNLLPLGPIS